jgi:hypothetical protein
MPKIAMPEWMARAARRCSDEAAGFAKHTPRPLVETGK